MCVIYFHFRSIGRCGYLEMIFEVTMQNGKNSEKKPYSSRISKLMGFGGPVTWGLKRSIAMCHKSDLVSIQNLSRIYVYHAM